MIGLSLVCVHYCNCYYCLQFLVSDTKYGEKLCNAANDAEHTPLYIASERGNQEAVNILLQHGASGYSPGLHANVHMQRSLI